MSRSETDCDEVSKLAADSNWKLLRISLKRINLLLRSDLINLRICHTSDSGIVVKSSSQTISQQFVV